MSMLILTKQEALDVLWGDSDKGRVVEDEIVDHTRWSVVHSIIIEYDNRFYSGDYSRGATEIQDEQPWEYEKEVAFYEVQKVEKTCVEW